MRDPPGADGATAARFGQRIIEFPSQQLHQATRTGKVVTDRLLLRGHGALRLFIDGKQIIDNNGLHAMEEKSGELHLKEGKHTIKVEFFENDVDAGCIFSWQPPGATKEIVPARVLSAQ